jgi:hypothetical protein
VAIPFDARFDPDEPSAEEPPPRVPSARRGRAGAGDSHRRRIEEYWEMRRLRAELEGFNDPEADRRATADRRIR